MEGAGGLFLAYLMSVVIAIVIVVVWQFLANRIRKFRGLWSPFGGEGRPQQVNRDVIYIRRLPVREVEASEEMSAPDNTKVREWERNRRRS